MITVLENVTQIFLLKRRQRGVDTRLTSPIHSVIIKDKGASWLNAESKRKNGKVDNRGLCPRKSSETLRERKCQFRFLPPTQ